MGIVENCTQVEVRVFLPHVAWYAKVFDMARSGQSLGHLLSSTRTRAASRAKPVQCQSSWAPIQLTIPSFSSLLQAPSHCPATKDKQRVGMVMCPSPPSGAACLCQDVSRHIVMKGVIKVTAGWSAAHSSSLSLPQYPSSPSLVAHFVFKKPVICNK